MIKYVQICNKQTNANVLQMLLRRPDYSSCHASGMYVHSKYKSLAIPMVNFNAVKIIRTATIYSIWLLTCFKIDCEM